LRYSGRLSAICQLPRIFSAWCRGIAGIAHPWTPCQNRAHQRRTHRIRPTTKANCSSVPTMRPNSLPDGFYPQELTNAQDSQQRRVASPRHCWLLQLPATREPRQPRFRNSLPKGRQSDGVAKSTALQLLPNRQLPGSKSEPDVDARASAARGSRLSLQAGPLRIKHYLSAAGRRYVHR